MRFLVFGAGALGSMVAARLGAAHEVGLVGRRDHVEAIRARGLRVAGKTDLRHDGITAVASAGELDGPAPDAVLVTVKAYDTAAAMAALHHWRDASIFVSLQNGLGNEEIMARSAGRVLGAVINHGVTFIGPGEVFHAGVGETTFGPFAGTTDADAEGLATAFSACGLPARVSADIRRDVWAKAILNAAINPISALLGRLTGELIEDADLLETMRLVVVESTGIAAACAIHLDAEAVFETVCAVAEATRDNKSSMLQDLERGRRTEIEAINGTLAARAREHGLPAPLNELLTRLVRAASATAGS